MNGIRSFLHSFHSTKERSEWCINGKGLPLELIFKILSNLSGGDLKRAGQVCNQWWHISNELLLKEAKGELPLCQEYIDKLLKNEIAAPDGVVSTLEKYFRDPETGTISINEKNIYFSILSPSYTILAPTIKKKETKSLFTMNFQNHYELREYLKEHKEKIPPSIYNLFLFGVLNYFDSLRVMSSTSSLLDGAFYHDDSNLEWVAGHFQKLGFIYSAVQCIDSIKQEAKIKELWKGVFVDIKERNSAKFSKKNVLKCVQISSYLKKLVKESFKQAGTQL